MVPGGHTPDGHGAGPAAERLPQHFEVDEVRQPVNRIAKAKTTRICFMTKTSRKGHAENRKLRQAQRRNSHRHHNRAALPGKEVRSDPYASYD